MVIISNLATSGRISGTGLQRLRITTSRAGGTKSRQGDDSRNDLNTRNGFCRSAMSKIQSCFVSQSRAALPLCQAIYYRGL